MRELPIIFSAPMVRAIIDGRKTQTRRVVKPQPPIGHEWAGWCIASTHSADEGKSTWAAGAGPCLRDAHRVRCPYGQPGDRLWVRETHAIFSTHGQHRKDGKRWGPWGGLPTTTSPDGTQIAYYREGFDRCDPGRWRPSIHMPRWASRITLEVTGVRVERLQAISEADALSEGVERHLGGWFPYGIETCLTTLVDGKERTAQFATEAAGSFRMLWESFNGAGSWDLNPWVWVIEFRRLP